jgi:hypothetical protein
LKAIREVFGNYYSGTPVESCSIRRVKCIVPDAQSPSELKLFCFVEAVFEWHTMLLEQKYFCLWFRLTEELSNLATLPDSLDAMA